MYILSPSKNRQVGVQAKVSVNEGSKNGVMGQGAAVGASVQRLLSIALIAYLAFIVYGSLVPLHFVARPFNEAVRVFANIRFLDLGIDARADWVANFLLFIPLGLGAGMRLAPASAGKVRWLSLLLLGVAGVGLAMAIEFTQIFFPGRTVSQNDIFAEGLGGWVGLGCAAIWGEGIFAWLAAYWQKENLAGRSSRLLNLYLLLLLAFSLMPLDLTLSPVEIYHKWRSGRVILLPFGNLHGSFFDILYGLLSDVLIWVPVGYLWSDHGRWRVSTVIVKGFLAALAIEVAQLFVYTRVSDVTDILLATVGAAFGAVIAVRGGVSGLVLDRFSAVAWRRLWWFWVVFVLAGFWYPFDFSATAASLGHVSAAVERAPFATYYGTSEYHALNELLRKVAMFLPGGALMAMASGGRRAPSGRLALFGPMLVALLVEGGQLFLPGKVADLTDWLIECVGAGLGWLAVRWLLAASLMEDSNAVVAGAPPANPPPLAAREPSGASFSERISWYVPLAWVAALGVIVFLVTRFPGVPYNVKELLAPGVAGVLSALALAAVLYFSANLPFLVCGSRPTSHLTLLPLGLLAHGIAAWTLLRLAVPLESLYDIIGAPILSWPWEWEMIGRFLALDAAIMMQVIGAAWAVQLLLSPSLLPRFLYWLVLAMMLSWPLHAVVVTGAATDNLVELMRGEGSYVTSAILAAGLFFFFAGGSALSASAAVGRYRARLIVVVFVAPLLATISFWLGQNGYIIKYDRTFSAAQFLLSADRAHYARGTALAVRYGIAVLAGMAGSALLQFSYWKRLLEVGKHSTGGGRRPGEPVVRTSGP
jgi:VanZ family protein